MKGISPLMASVLLIAFTLAVAVIIGGWLTSISRQETETVGKGLIAQVNCSKAVLTVIDATCNSTAVSIALANLGGIDLTNPTFYVRTTGGNSTTWASTQTISPGGTIISTNTTNWGGQTLDYVSVTALCGGTTGITTEKSSIGDSC